MSGMLPLTVPVKLDEDRGRDWYEISWLHTNLDYERLWRVSSQGELGFATQVKYPLSGEGDFWSLCDVALGLIATLVAAKSWWEPINYFGEARLLAWLNVQSLKLYEFSNYPWGFGPLFYNRGKWPERDWPLKVAGVPEYPFSEVDMSLPKDVLSLSQVQSSGNAVAEVDLNYAQLTEGLSEIVALVLNQFMRSLKHLVNLKRLREETTYLVTKLRL